MANRDLFEDLKERVWCDYISDLKCEPWLDMARRVITQMNLSIYPLFALNDAAEYLYGDKQRFTGSEAALEYFKKRLRSVR